MICMSSRQNVSVSLTLVQSTAPSSSSCLLITSTCVGLSGLRPGCQGMAVCVPFLFYTSAWQWPFVCQLLIYYSHLYTRHGRLCAIYLYATATYIITAWLGRLCANYLSTTATYLPQPGNGRFVCLFFIHHSMLYVDVVFLDYHGDLWLCEVWATASSLLPLQHGSIKIVCQGWILYIYLSICIYIFLYIFIYTTASCSYSWHIPLTSPRWVLCRLCADYRSSFTCVYRCVHVGAWYF